TEEWIASNPIERRPLRIQLGCCSTLSRAESFALREATVCPDGLAIGQTALRSIASLLRGSLWEPIGGMLSHPRHGILNSYGWSDGQRRPLDDDSGLLKFTPRPLRRALAHQISH